MLNARIETYGHKPVVGDLVLNDRVPTHVTQDTLESYKMHDVVLPLPGTDSKYPDNTMKDLYSQYMAQLGINNRIMAQRYNPSLILTSREFRLTGTYRCIVGEVRDLRYSFLDYNKATDILLASDNDVLNETLREGVDDGDLTAMKLSFSIESKQSVTMALRELMKNNEY